MCTCGPITIPRVAASIFIVILSSVGVHSQKYITFSFLQLYFSFDAGLVLHLFKDGLEMEDLLPRYCNFLLFIIMMDFFLQAVLIVDQISCCYNRISVCIPMECRLPAITLFARGVLVLHILV